MIFADGVYMSSRSKIKFLLVFLAIYSIEAGQLIRSELILEDRFPSVIEQSLDFLKRRQKRDGSYIYDHFPFQGRTIYKGSWVRQAGTFMAMALAYDETKTELKESLDKAISFFKQNSVGFVRDGLKMRIISENHEGYTGTMCLFLIGYFHLHRLNPVAFPIESSIYQEIMDTLAYYHHEDAGITRYINIKEDYIEKHRRDSEIYASAQHFVLLAMYHRVFQRKYLHPSLLSYLDLYKRKWTYGELGPSYHWVMMALKILNELNNAELNTQVLQAAHELQMAMEKEYPLDFLTNNYCARLEGFGSYLQILQTNNLLDRRDLYKLTKHLRYSRNFQLKTETRKKAALPGSPQKAGKPELRIEQKNPSHSVGGFWHREVDGYHTRIDVTQHCLSAFTYHEQIMDKIPDKPWEPPEDEDWMYDTSSIEEKKLYPIILKTIYR